MGLFLATASGSSAPVRLDVPAIPQARERCGPAALGMVLRCYGAGPEAIAEADRAYDPALRGSLITDLAACARRAGFAAEVVTLAPDSLAACLGRGVPPILLVRNGVGPVTLPHDAVVIGWDPARRRYAVNDGGRTTRTMGVEDLVRRWRGGDFRALLVHRAPPAGALDEAEARAGPRARGGPEGPGAAK